MPTTITPTSSQLAGIRAGEITKIAVRMKVQPDGEPASLIEWAEGLATHCLPRPTQQQIIDKARQLEGKIFPFRRTGKRHLFSPSKPYDLNARIGVKETWSTRLISDDVIYRADYPKDTCYVWRSPVTMPSSATRTWLVPKECELKRVRGLSVEDAIAFGFKSYLREHDACVDLLDQVKELIISRLGQHAWDDNHFIFIYDIQKEGV